MYQFVKHEIDSTLDTVPLTRKQLQTWVGGSLTYERQTKALKDYVHAAEIHAATGDITAGGILAATNLFDLLDSLFFEIGITVYSHSENAETKYILQAYKEFIFEHIAAGTMNKDFKESLSSSSYNALQEDMQLILSGKLKNILQLKFLNNYLLTQQVKKLKKDSVITYMEYKDDQSNIYFKIQICVDLNTQKPVMMNKSTYSSSTSIHDFKVARLYSLVIDSLQSK